jgi:outer membrane protein OmpA-like peptidoglycan-associated protein
MRRRAAIILALALLGGCGGQDGKSYSLFFQPFSTGLNPEAQQSVQAAAAFASAHPLMPVTIAGDTPPPGMQDDSLSQQRVQVVRSALVVRGVGGERIELLGDERMVNPDGMTGMPARRVDIRIGL